MSVPRCMIRRATRTDVPRILAGIEAICDEGGAFYTTQFIPTPQWEAALSNPGISPNLVLAVAEVEGQFAGAGRLFPGGEHTLFQHTAELGMFVLPPFRRQGIGRLLVYWLLNWALEVGLAKINLCVFATNKPALNLYRSIGFFEEGRQLRQIRQAGKEIDLIWMGLFLPQAETSRTVVC